MIKIPVNLNQQEKEALVMEEENMDLKIVLGCDSQHAEAIENTFRKCVDKEIKSVEVVPSEMKGKLVKVSVDDGEIYFLKISSIYFLREIRKDSQDGEIIYQVVY